MFELSNYKDINDDVINLVNTYYSYLDNNDTENAYDFLEQNKTILAPYVINANSFNKIELAIYETAQKVTNSQRLVISSTIPDTSLMVHGSEWLKEY